MCSVECYWHCSDETVHEKFDKTVNFAVLHMQLTTVIYVAYNRFYKLHFYIY